MIQFSRYSRPSLEQSSWSAWSWACDDWNHHHLQAFCSSSPRSPSSSSPAPPTLSAPSVSSPQWSLLLVLVHTPWEHRESRGTNHRNCSLHVCADLEQSAGCWNKIINFIALFRFNTPTSDNNNDTWVWPSAGTFFLCSVLTVKGGQIITRYLSLKNSSF